MLIWLVWLFLLILQVGNACLHYAMTDPLLLKQGTRAFSLATMAGVGLGVVLMLIRMPGFRETFKRKTGEDFPDAEVETSTSATPPPPPKNASGGFIDLAMLWITITLGILALALSLMGCAHGADGLRQACTNTNQLIEGAYETTGNVYKADQEHLRAEFKAGEINAASLQTLLDDHKLIVDRALAGLDTLRQSKKALCGVIPAVEAGQRKDMGELISAVVQVGVSVGALLSSIDELIRLEKPRAIRERLLCMRRAPPRRLRTTEVL